MGIDWVKWCIFMLAGTILVLAGAVYFGLESSLPRRDGEVALAGLTSPAEIELDKHAIPRIRAASMVDAFRGQGFMHAQERFFEMDLFRRSAAAELAALVGQRALPLDRAQRPYDLRRRAHELLAQLPAEEREWLDAYTQGVNAGLVDLGTRPPEYWLLGAPPEPWRSEDTLLVVFSLYTMVSNNDYYERPQGVMHAVLPQALYDFLTPSTSRFDRPLVGASASDRTGGYVPLPIPGPEVVDLRQFSRLPTPRGPPRVDPPLLGPASNQWAVDATRSVDDDAILANDPHLSLRVPSILYRCELNWPGGAERGASIPGVPGILIGASDTLAWGVTVSNADQSDWVVVELDPADTSRYLTPDGPEAFGTSTVDIAVAGRTSPERLELRTTRWGPVVSRDWRGRPLALHATWLEAGGLDLDILGLAAAKTVSDGVAVVERWAGPSLNWMLADTAGHIAWAVNGPLPRRAGFDGSRPESWADGTRTWQGEAEWPVLLGGEDSELFTANNRTLPPERANAISRMWMRPLRAQRIEELLAAREDLDEPDFLAMQLDTRASGYDQIRDVLLDVVPADEKDPLLAKARMLVAAWNGNADVDQPGFRILHIYYRALLERVLAPLLGPAGEADHEFVYRWPLADEPLRRILDERPAHFLTKDFADWPTFLRQVLLDELHELGHDERRPALEASWGDVNRLEVAHPLTGVPVIGPVLARWLKLPEVPLPGSTLSLRVAAPDYGALIRMSVAPAHQGEGIMEMAGGQSGHFLSPNFADLQKDWVDGTPTPFLAGPTATRFVIEPAH